MTGDPDDREYLHRLIMARCGDLITADDLALLADLPDVPIWEAVVDVVDALERKLAMLEQGLADAPRFTH